MEMAEFAANPTVFKSTYRNGTKKNYFPNQIPEARSSKVPQFFSNYMKLNPFFTLSHRDKADFVVFFSMPFSTYYSLAGVSIYARSPSCRFIFIRLCKQNLARSIALPNLNGSLVQRRSSTHFSSCAHFYFLYSNIVSFIIHFTSCSPVNVYHFSRRARSGKRNQKIK